LASFATHLLLLSELLTQIAMAGMGGLALWGVQKRKRLHMTQYDYRKSRQNR